MIYAIGIMIKIALNLYIAWGSINILMMLILPIHKHSICFHLFVFSSIYFFNVYNFLRTGLSTPLLNLFLGISLEIIVDGIISQFS